MRSLVWRVAPLWKSQSARAWVDIHPPFTSLGVNIVKEKKQLHPRDYITKVDRPKNTFAEAKLPAILLQ